MPDLNFTTAVRNWSHERYAVEFPGQWEAKRYLFFVPGEALEKIGDLDPAFDANSALRVFDDHLGILLAAADFLWEQSDKMQDEYVITAEVLENFEERTAPRHGNAKITKSGRAADNDDIAPS
ncbi:DUF1488 family protein [Novosphingobium sp. BL-8H]|uniref:DUF1488 family protein n=1 Tax=Novosphingobium sp. BL-8H TaxID=3127640 RepID=UPI003757A41C